jgi:hypothetical protein
MAVMLVGATTLATEDAFADKKKYDKNKRHHKQTLVKMINYQCMSSVKTLTHKFRAKKTQ